MAQLSKGFKSCFINYEKNGIIRHPDLKDSNDTSMDAVIGYMLYCKLHYPEDVYESWMFRIPVEISDKYKWTSFWYDWVKMQSGRSKGNLFYLGTILLGIGMALTIWPMKWLGFKKGKYYFNFFNVHLNAWMIYFSPDSRFKKIASHFLSLAVPRYNTLVRLLLQKGFKMRIKKPMEGWEWQRLHWVKYTGITNKVISHNQAGIAIDVDILDCFL